MTIRVWIWTELSTHARGCLVLRSSIRLGRIAVEVLTKPFRDQDLLDCDPPGFGSRPGHAPHKRALASCDALRVLTER